MGGMTMGTSEFGNNASGEDQATLSWDPLSEVTQVNVVNGDSGAWGATITKGGISDANPEGDPIGVLLPMVINPDGS